MLSSNFDIFRVTFLKQKVVLDGKVTSSKRCWVISTSRLLDFSTSKNATYNHLNIIKKIVSIVDIDIWASASTSASTSKNVLSHLDAWVKRRDQSDQHFNILIVCGKKFPLRAESGVVNLPEPSTGGRTSNQLRRFCSVFQCSVTTFVEHCDLNC